MRIQGCATTASRYVEVVPDGAPGVTEIIGSFHDEFLGIHRIGTLTLIGHRNAERAGEVVPIETLREGSWSVAFVALERDADEARRWIDANGPMLRTGLGRTAAFLDSAYPDSGGRDFHVLVLPSGAGIDRTWQHLAISDRRLRLTYALPIPSAGAEPRAASKSLLDMFPVLGHEFSHSYFWFHRDRYRNNYSDEVIAYTTERCVEAEVLGLDPSFLPPAPANLAASSDRLSPGELYGRFRKQYSDSLIASVAASARLRSVAGGGPAGGLSAYCRHVPLSGVDFESIGP